jgi:hypothetical protein
MQKLNTATRYRSPEWPGRRTRNRIECSGGTEEAEREGVMDLGAQDRRAEPSGRGRPPMSSRNGARLSRDSRRNPDKSAAREEDGGGFLAEIKCTAVRVGAATGPCDRSILPRIGFPSVVSSLASTRRRIRKPCDNGRVTLAIRNLVGRLFPINACEPISFLKRFECSLIGRDPLRQLFGTTLRCQMCHRP